MEKEKNREIIIGKEGMEDHQSGADDAVTEKNRNGEDDVVTERNQNGEDDAVTEKNRNGEDDAVTEKNRNGEDDVVTERNQNGEDDILTEKNQSGEDGIQAEKNSTVENNSPQEENKKNGKNNRGEQKDPYLLSTVSNTLGVLDLLSHYQGLTLAEIHRKTGQDKASLFRILYTLEKGGYVEKIEGAKYRLGYKFFFYGNRAALNSDIVQVARPFLQGLAFETKLAAHLGALHNGRIVTIHKEESPYDVQVTARVGSNAPAYATAQGQAILAFLPEERREHIIRDYTYRQYSPKSILNVDECRKVLDEVRRLGYGTDIDDRFPGVGSYAVPIFDYTGEPVASVGVVATSQRLLENKDEVLPKIFETARGISDRLGAQENR